MSLTDTITSAQKYQLTVKPEDASGNLASLPGPVAWGLADDSLGTITPSTDTLDCLFAPAPGKAGVAQIVGTVPSAPSIPPVEADITVTLPLADHLVLTGQVVG